MTPTTNSKELMLGEVSVIVRELTVLQVRTWLADTINPNGQPDIVDQALFSECSLEDLQRMTSLTREQIDQLRPSELRRVITLSMEMNPDFFALLGRLVKPAAATV